MDVDAVDIPTSSKAAIEALDLFSGKWHPVVFLAIRDHGAVGFNELLETVPSITGKMLSETLADLTDAGLVERTEVSEAPLRVEYSLSDIGAELNPVFGALSEWGSRHLETTAKVLVADDDRRIMRMYEQWLDERYEVFAVNTAEALARVLDREIDLAILDDGLASFDDDAFWEEFGDIRTILLVGDRPGVDLLEAGCDDVLRKPLVRETLMGAIDSQLSPREESPEERELSGIEAKVSLLESIYSTARLQRSGTYREYRAKLEDPGDVSSSTEV